jgi:hypothetical protein
MEAAAAGAELRYTGRQPERTMSDEHAKPPPPAIQIQISDEIAEGFYSNLVMINHSENEFVLDFAFLPPGNPRAKVLARVISSPRHTKRLLDALSKNMGRFEERFGAIEIGDEQGPTFH